MQGAYGSLLQEGQGRDSVSSDSHRPTQQVRLGWQGTCVHDYDMPKWVGKRRQVDPEQTPSERVYEEPKRAVSVAINGKFSLMAIGMHG